MGKYIIEVEQGVWVTGNSTFSSGTTDKQYAYVFNSIEAAIGALKMARTILPFKNAKIESYDSIKIKSAPDRGWLDWNGTFWEFDDDDDGDGDIDTNLYTPFTRTAFIIDKLKRLEDEWREAEEEYGESAKTDRHMRLPAVVLHRKRNDLAKLRKELEG